MSTDLQFRPSLPEIQLPTIEINPPQPFDLTDDEDSSITIQAEKIDVYDEADCHTPKGPEHRIPAILQCPPAPKKKYSKRKLSELENTVKIVIDEAEIEKFFRDLEAQDDNNKRRCPPSS